MTLWSIAAMSFVVGLSGALMPGPLLTLTISEAARRGPQVGLILALGHALLEAVVVALMFLGLAEFAQKTGVFGTVALLGGGMLVWMGLGMLRSLPRLTVAVAAGSGSGLHPLLAGALVSLANPYFILWWATVGMSYLFVANEAGTAGVMVFYLFHILSDLVWYSFVGGAVGAGRRFLSDRIYRWLVGSCASLICTFGIYFGYRGVAALW